MTIEAETAIQVSYKFEAKKDALRQMQDGGIKVTFTINPDDMPQELYADKMGQRFLIVAVPLNEDETPRIPEKKKGNQVKAWLSHYNNGYSVLEVYETDLWFSKLTDKEVAEKAEAIIEKLCMVDSCSEIREGTPAWSKFKEIQQRVMDYQRYGE